MAVETRTGCCEREAAVEDDPSDQGVLEFVSADAAEIRAAVSREEDADPGIRIGARVRLAGPDPESVIWVDSHRADRQRRRIVEER